MFGGDAWSPGRRHIEELPIPAIPEQLPGLLEFFAKVVLLNERVHMAVGDKQVLPSIIVNVQKCGAPLYILGVHRQAGGRW